LKTNGLTATSVVITGSHVKCYCL